MCQSRCSAIAHHHPRLPALAALGGKEDVERFTGRALARLGGALEPLGSSKHRGFKTPLNALPEDVRERLETADVPASFRGAPLALITAGLMALAFMGFAGLGSR